MSRVTDRSIIMATFTFFALCPFGLEDFVTKELVALGADPDLIKTQRSGVQFSGPQTLGMAMCLQSRFASRILVRVAHADYWDSHDLYDLARRTPWEKWFDVDLTFSIDKAADRCPLESLDFAALRVKDGICDRFRELAGRRPDVARRHPDVPIFMFLTYDRATFYIDMCGQALFKRGWRLAHGEAPLKENMAAGLLALAEWSPNEPLIDPFCGSGTIAIEAALYAMNVAPGLYRDFAFEKLHNFDLEAYEELREDARARINRHVNVRIQASDISSLVVEKAIENAQRAGLGDMLADGRLSFSQGDAREVTPAADMPAGVLIANPPYGEQSNPKSASIRAMMGDIATNLKNHYAGWRAWLLTSDRQLPSQMRLKPSRKVVVYNGPLECRFFKFDMVAGSNRRVKDNAHETSPD